MPKIGIDNECLKLAAHFLSDVAGASDRDRWELAGRLQEICESGCREIERQQANAEFDRRIARAVKRGADAHPKDL